MVSLLITVLVFGVLCYLIFWAMGYLLVPEPIRKIVTVIVVAIVVIWLFTLIPGTRVGLPLR